MLQFLVNEYGLSSVFWAGVAACALVLGAGWAATALLHRSAQRLAALRLASLEEEGEEWEARATQAEARAAGLEQERARLATQLARLAERVEHLLRVERRAHALEARLAEQDREGAVLRTRLDEQRQALEDKLALLEHARGQLGDTFQALAERIFEQKHERFGRESGERLTALLDPLRTQIGRFEQQVANAQLEDTKARSALAQELRQLQALNRQLSDDAVNLARALTGDSKARGNWGELALERLLEASGLQEGREYALEVSRRDEAGRLFRPDAVITLPNERHVIVDAKVSLNAHVEYCAAEDDAAREQAMKRHLAALRGHLRQLGEKRYDQLEGFNALDVVLMFVPVEAAFVDAIRAEPGLYDEALKASIVLVCPSTLLATLKTIAMMWRLEHRNRNAEEIARQAGNLYDKFVGFVEELQRMGQQIDRLRESHRVALNRLSEGRGNLVGRVERLRELGAETSRTLPRDLDVAGDEGEH